MGNAIDKKGEAKARVISRMIRNFLKEESRLDEGEMKFERKKIVGMKSSKIKDKNIIGASMVMAEEIIKTCLFRTNDVNTQIYNSLIVFDNLDQNDGNIFYDEKYEKNEKNDKKFSDEKTSKISNILNLEENEELSNYCQLKSVNNLFFPSITENKFNNTIAKLFEDFKIAKEKEKEKGNITLSRNTGTLNSQDLKTEFLQSEIFTPSRSNININITHAQSPVKASDSSLELVSLQEYLKRESDRLKNDQDYLNYKNRKESLIMKEQREEQLMKEILNMKTTTTMNTPSNIIQQFQLQKKNKSVNLLKNKNFVNVKKGKPDTIKDKNNNNTLKKDSFNSLHQNSTQLNKNYKQSNSLRNFYILPSDTKRNTKIHNIHNTILHSPTNKSTSKSKFLNITNHTIVNTCPDSNRFNKKVIVPKMPQSRNINFSNTKIKLNFSPKKGSNPISPNNLSVNNTINMRERERERENQTLTTKTTSRPSSYSRQAMKNLNINNVNNVNNVMPMSNEKNENIFKIDLSRKNSGKNFKSNNVINERYNSDDMENFVVDLRDKPVMPQAMASIKIDIRELLQEGDDKSEDQSILKTQENYNDKSYSDILHTENYQNASNAWNSKELEDLIIVKQTVDKNGRIVI
jgi:hypothetical protein